jgi:hypothetical protein
MKDLRSKLNTVLLRHAAELARDDESVLADALAELMYWADSNGVDFESALGRALSYHANNL